MQPGFRPRRGMRARVRGRSGSPPPGGRSLRSTSPRPRATSRGRRLTPPERRLPSASSGWKGDLGTWTPLPGRYDLVSCLYVHVAGSVVEMVRRPSHGCRRRWNAAPRRTPPHRPGHRPPTPAAGQVQVSVDEAVEARPARLGHRRCGGAPAGRGGQRCRCGGPRGPRRLAGQPRRSGSTARTEVRVQFREHRLDRWAGIGAAPPRGIHLALRWPLQRPGDEPVCQGPASKARTRATTSPEATSDSWVAKSSTRWRTSASPGMSANSRRNHWWHTVPGGLVTHTWPARSAL